MSKRTFDRWKDAEEHAKDLIDEGRRIRITMKCDVPHVEEGEEYVYDEFIVHDLGAR